MQTKHFILFFFSPETSSLEANSLFQLLQKILKYCGILLKNHSKCSEKIASKFSIENFQQILMQIVASTSTPLDLRLNCSLLFVQMDLANQKDLIDVFKKIYYKEERFENINDLDQMSLFYGHLCCLESKHLFTPKLMGCKDDLASYMLKRLPSIINSTHCGFTAVIVCRILNNLLIRLCDYVKLAEISDNVFQQELYNKYALNSTNTNLILELIWMLWDHYLENVKHIAKETFIILLKVQIHINSKEAVVYFTGLASSLAHSLIQRQSFRALICLVPFIEVDSLIKSNLEIINDLFKMLSDSTYAPHSANLLEAIFTKHYSEINQDDWERFWLAAFFDNFSIGMLVYGYESLLEKLFNIGGNICQAILLLSSSESLDDLKHCLLIMCTKISIKAIGKKKIGPIQKFSSGADGNENYWKDILPFHILVASLDSADDELKILSFNLLCDNSKSTALYDERELRVLKSFIIKNITNNYVSFCQNFVNNIKKALSRIAKGISSQIKLYTSISDKSELNKTIDIHTTFICDLFHFLTNSICVGSSFNKRSTSLRIMELFFDLLHEANFSYLKNRLFLQPLRDSLILCLRDSYEDNKKIAQKLLILMLEDHQFKGKQIDCILIQSVWTLASSSRSSDSLTASYLLNAFLKDLPVTIQEDFPAVVRENPRLLACSFILNKLENEISIAQQSLFEAATSGPMYGLLLCLRSLFANLEERDLIQRELWKNLMKKIIEACLLVAKIVAKVVANSSPEGHLPIDLTQSNDIFTSDTNISIENQEHVLGMVSDKSLRNNRTAKAQLLLVCGWRNIKEVSLLFGIFIQGSRAVDTLTLLSQEEVELIGTFFLTQLTETKHRGAFEQAYNGFVMVCNKLWRCKSVVNKFPQTWLNYIIEAIQDMNNNRLCTTRRSAGVPFIIQAILTTEPRLRAGNSLKSAIDTLFNLSSDPEIHLECKIHVLNILRALFRDAKISEEIIPYVSKGVKLAVEGYANNSWFVRNSSSLMFASLVNRMLGVKKTQEDLHSKNAVSAFVFFKRYSDLYEFFLEKLSLSVIELKRGESAASSFPLLMLLARLSQTSTDGYSSSISLMPFVPLILDFTSSPVYQLRCLASKALIPLTTPLMAVNLIEQLCSSLSLENQNHLHGSLLCLIKLCESFLKNILDSKENRDKLIASFSSIAWIASEANPCLFTRAFAIDLFNILVKHHLCFSQTLKFLISESFIFLSCPSFNKYQHVPGIDLAYKAYISFFLNVYEKNENRNQELLLNFLKLPSLDVQTQVLRHFLLIESGQGLIKTVLSRLEKNDDHPDCINLFYNILTKRLQKFEPNDCIYRDILDKILATIFERLNLEMRGEYIISLIATSEAIITYKIKVSFIDLHFFFLSETSVPSFPL